MIEQKFTGFILNKTKYKDNDVIINILTSDGKITFKANGINKISSKNAPKCNYFMLSEFVLTSKSEISNKTLKQASIVKIFKKPFDDLLASSCYLLICSILRSLDDINGYEMALDCFNKQETGIYPINVLNYFLANVVIALGYEPEITNCSICKGKQNIISFDFESGGFVCKKCFDNTRHIKYPTTILKDIIKIFSFKDYENIDKNNSVIIFKMFVDFLKDNISINEENYNFVLKCI